MLRRGAAWVAHGAWRGFSHTPTTAVSTLAIVDAPLTRRAGQLSLRRHRCWLHVGGGCTPTVFAAGALLAEHRRSYATAGPSGGSGGHDHRAGDGKSSGAGGGSVHTPSSAGVGGVGSGGSVGASRRGEQARRVPKKTMKSKSSRRIVKRKRAGQRSERAASARASSGSGPAASTPLHSTPATTAASQGTAAGGGGGSAGVGVGVGVGASAAAAPVASATNTRVAARRRKRKTTRTPAPTAATSSSSGSSSRDSSGNTSAAARRTKRPLTRKRAPSAAAPRKASTAAPPAGASGRTAPPTPATAATTTAKKRKRIRVCVLSSSYDGADSATASVDNYWCTPQHYMKKDRHKYAFADVSMKKIDSYRAVRELVTSGKYDVFFNLCDGGRDEKRAGVDVVQALEEHNAAFTGTDSRSFEPSKIDMKLMVGSSGVKVPNFVLLSNEESLAKKCRHLKFPVIVKHLSGYASVGIHKDNRCDTLDQLRTRVRGFMKEFNHALVEEFIRGREGTVLTCADPGSPFGVKVFKPLMFNFLQNHDDFAYFEKKWTMECGDEAYGFLAATDPAYPAITEMARNAFKYIMSGVGYGRVDFRIDERTGAPYFLEINPNCGMWYAPKDGGDFADVMVEGDPHWNHERFLANAVTRALRDQAARKPWYFISHDRNGQFSTRASKTVPAGKCLFGDAVHPIPVVAKALYKLGEEEPTVGCVISRGDGVHHAVALRHSCEPNMNFVHGRTLLFAAKRSINVGEELTVDFATLRDEAMPHFVCSCGTENCRSVIFPMPAMPRTVEAKTMRRLLREKKPIWMKEKADREAERILKKRSSPTASSGGSVGSTTAATSLPAASGSGSGSVSGSGGAHTTTTTTTTGSASAHTSSGATAEKK